MAALQRIGLPSKFYIFFLIYLILLIKFNKIKRYDFKYVQKFKTISNWSNLLIKINKI